jgi:hypothetical protein
VFRLDSLRGADGSPSQAPEAPRASGTDGRPTYRRVGEITYVAVNRRIDPQR